MVTSKFSVLMKTSSGCSGISLMASCRVFALIAKEMSWSHSTNSRLVCKVVSLSEAVMCICRPLMSNLKQSRMGMLFFWAITRPMPLRWVAKSALGTTNLMVVECMEMWFVCLQIKAPWLRLSVWCLFKSLQMYEKNRGHLFLHRKMLHGIMICYSLIRIQILRRD